MKNLKNLGKALSKAEQKTINGGKYGVCTKGQYASGCYDTTQGCICPLLP